MPVDRYLTHRQARRRLARYVDKQISELMLYSPILSTAPNPKRRGQRLWRLDEIRAVCAELAALDGRG
jgi:hypothetical protein